MQKYLRLQNEFGANKKSNYNNNIYKNAMKEFVSLWPFQKYKVSHVLIHTSGFGFALPWNDARQITCNPKWNQMSTSHRKNIMQT